MESPQTQSRDTSTEAERFLIEAWRRMEPWEKAEILDDLVRASHELTMAGLRVRHPRASESELRLFEARLRLGDSLFSRACPQADWVDLA